MLKQLFLLFILILLMNGCDGGIEPQPENMQTGFGGKINFIGEWPDSVIRTHLVVFKNPLKSVGDFSPLNLRFVGEEIPFGTVEYNYSSLDTIVFLGIDIQPGDYAYVAVAQSAVIELSLNREDWFVAGLYYNEGDTTKPGTLQIIENVFVNSINIICDFNNPPPQPPGGN